MNARLCRRYRFSASHRLHLASLTDEQNRDLFGKCNNPYGHGHNYTVEVSFGGPVDPVTGMVTNLAELDRFAQEHVLNLLDQTNLNCVSLFADQVPSTEHLAVELHRLFSAYPHARLERVHVEETGRNSFTYFVPAQLDPEQKGGAHAL